MIREDSIPALWMASGAVLQPVCEHPHEAHSVDDVALPGLPLPRCTHEEELYLVRAARLVAITEGAKPPVSPRRSTRDAAPQLVECIRSYWSAQSGSTTLPLQRVADPSDSSQQRWMCKKHAKAVLQATALNLYMRPCAPGDTRYMRLRDEKIETANALAFHLAERAEVWYTKHLLPLTRRWMVVQQLLLKHGPPGAVLERCSTKKRWKAGDHEWAKPVPEKALYVVKGASAVVAAKLHETLGVETCVGAVAVLVRWPAEEVELPPTTTEVDVQCKGDNDGCRSCSKDATKTPCNTCRAWAQAIKQLHVSAQSLVRNRGWRNCISQQWSSEVSLPAGACGTPPPQLLCSNTAQCIADCQPDAGGACVGCRQGLHAIGCPEGY